MKILAGAARKDYSTPVAVTGFQHVVLHHSMFHAVGFTGNNLYSLAGQLGPDFLL
jgi:hypothetical protein